MSIAKVYTTLFASKLKLGLPRCATFAILYYLSVCFPAFLKCKATLTCISASADPQLLELGLQLHLGNAYLRLQICTTTDIVQGSITTFIIFFGPSP